MKKYIFLIVLIFSFSTSKSLSQINYCLISHDEAFPTDTVPTYLGSLNLEAFKGKPVDTILAKIPAGYISMNIYGGDNPKRAAKLLVVYANHVVAEIHVRKFHFMNPWSDTMSWDMALFKKEKVYRIIIYSGSDCINGCLN